MFIVWQRPEEDHPMENVPNLRPVIDYRLATGRDVKFFVRRNSKAVQWDRLVAFRVELSGLLYDRSDRIFYRIIRDELGLM
jgi:hypothetical protein